MIAQDKKIAFIGSGFIAEAMVSGIVETKVMKPENILVVNPGNPVSAGRLQESYGVVHADPQDIEKADYVFFAVKPQMIEKVLEQYKKWFTPDKLYISVMAGISTAFLEEHLGNARVVRTMPNLALSIRRSATAYAPGKYASAEDEQVAVDLFQSLGLIVKTEENMISSVTALSGSGPAYFYLLTEAMAQSAIANGMDEDTAVKLARETFFGAARLLESTGQSASEMRRRVTSKGGTTEAALNAMRENGIEKAVDEGYLAARNRSDELGK